MLISLDKQYTTRSGLPVRLFQVNVSGTVVGMFKVGGVWEPNKWSSTGRTINDISSWDLVEVKPVHTIWVAISTSGRIEFQRDTLKECKAQYIHPEVVVTFKKLTFIIGESDSE